MAIEKEILEKLQKLSPEKQRELLDFAEFLAAKASQKQETWQPGFFDEVVGGWAGAPLERAPQGEPERRDDWP